MKPRLARRIQQPLRQQAGCRRIGRNTREQFGVTNEHGRTIAIIILDAANMADRLIHTAILDHCAFAERRGADEIDGISSGEKA
ncbi:hypothetical protein GCM10011342_11230 [Aquisalinus flavus]|uniref:Uncharacterized protein n=1 Tax=Aquisalinus flavus TaxID=1526572 RepID=A0A8J2V5M7_9PROT|nr:hypothetical protein GCM10011342_11230 [Aquisalinus flavus]